MKKIIRVRLKPGKGSSGEFISVKGRIVGLIEKNKGDNFDFVIEENNKKSIKSFGPDFIDNDLVDTEVPIIDDKQFARFSEDGSIQIVGNTNESLMRQSSVDQLKMVRKLSKGTDIGDRISNMNKEGSNIQYIQNPIDSGIESYEDFEKSNKNFQPSWNLKHLNSPFKK